jgi:hypothetical protein
MHRRTPPPCYGVRLGHCGAGARTRPLADQTTGSCRLLSWANDCSSFRRSCASMRWTVMPWRIWDEGRDWDTGMLGCMQGRRCAEMPRRKGTAACAVCPGRRGRPARGTSAASPPTRPAPHTQNRSAPAPCDSREPAPDSRYTRKPARKPTRKPTWKPETDSEADSEAGSRVRSRVGSGLGSRKLTRKPTWKPEAEPEAESEADIEADLKAGSGLGSRVGLPCKVRLQIQPQFRLPGSFGRASGGGERRIDDG